MPHDRRISFSLTNTAGASASITATSGTPQSTTVATAFANPLVVTVLDSNNNPVSGVTVTFTAPSAVTTAASGKPNTRISFVAPGTTSGCTPAAE